MRLAAFKNSVEIHQGKHHPNVTDIHFDRVGDGWRQVFMLRGDAHYDNVHCRQDVELRDLERAKELNAGIIDVGIGVIGQPEQQRRRQAAHAPGQPGGP